MRKLQTDDRRGNFKGTDCRGKLRCGRPNLDPRATRGNAAPPINLAAYLHI